MASVNTNAAAITALRTLQQTNATLDKTQSRISTGYKIGEAKDNAAYWAISTTLKSDNKALSTVKDALGLGASTVDTAYQGLNKAKDVLDEIKSKLTAATQDGVNRDTIQDEIGQLQDQLKSIATSSVFSGENWLSIDSSASGYSSAKTVVSSFSRDGNNAVTIGTIDVNTNTVSLFDANTTAATRGILDTNKALKTSNGTALTYGGTTLGNLSAGGIQKSNAVVTSAVTVTATNAFVAGSHTADFAEAGDSAVITVALDGLSPVSLTLNHTNALAADTSTNTGVINTVGEWKALLQATFDQNNIAVTVGLNTAGDTLTYTSTTTGAAANIVVGVTSVTNAGAGTALTTGQLAALTTSASTTNADRAFTVAKATLGTFNGPLTLDSDDKITFTIGRDNDSAETRVVTITKAIADSVTTRADGKINSVAEMSAIFAKALETSKTTAGVTDNVSADYTVGYADGAVTIASKITTKLSNVTVSNISATASNTPGVGDAVSVIGMDISNAGLLASGAMNTDGTLDSTKVKAVLSAYISVVNDAISKVTDAAASLGSVATRIDLQKSFVDTLMDTIDKGVGNLIDADMSEESTKLQALQVKQQLGVQALSIANQASQSILSLFRS